MNHSEDKADAMPSQSDGSMDKTQKVRETAERAVEKVSQESKMTADRLGEMMKEPTTGAAIAGAAVVGSAVFIGLPETAVGAIAGYVTYHILKKMKRSSEE